MFSQCLLIICVHISLPLSLPASSYLPIYLPNSSYSYPYINLPFPTQRIILAVAVVVGLVAMVTAMPEPEPGYRRFGYLGYGGLGGYGGYGGLRGYGGLGGYGARPLYGWRRTLDHLASSWHRKAQSESIFYFRIPIIFTFQFPICSIFSLQYQSSIVIRP